MLDRAKAGGFAYPAINCTSSETINAALRGFADAGSDGIIQVSTGGAEFASGTKRQGHGHRRGRARRVRARRRREVPDQRRAAHRPLPEGQARHLRPAADRDLAGAGRRRANAAVPVAHVGRLGGRAGGEPARSPPSCWTKAAKAHIILELEIGVVGGEEDGVVGEIEREALHDPGRRAAHRRGARHRREGPLPAGRDLRQRARRLQAGQREAAPGDPQGDPGRGRRRRSARTSRSTWSSTAAPARSWTRSARRSATAW